MLVDHRSRLETDLLSECLQFCGKVKLIVKSLASIRLLCLFCSLILAYIMAQEFFVSTFNSHCAIYDLFVARNFVFTMFEYFYV